MAYARYDSTAPNPPVLLSAQPIAFGSTQGTLSASGAGGGKLYAYNSTHLQTDIGSSDFISDGQAIGMVAGDVIMGITASGVTFHRVTTVGSTYVTCTAGLLVSSAS